MSRRAISLQPPVDVDPAALLLLSTAGGLAAALWTVDPTVALAVPLVYRRDDGADPLENDTRRRLYREIRRSTCPYLAGLSGAVDVAPSTVRYHCRVLRDRGLVETRKVNGRRRYFPVGSDDVALAAVLEDDATRALLEAIFRREPVTNAGLTDALDRAPSTVSYHLQRLDEAGLVERDRVDEGVATRLTPAVRDRIADGRTDEEPEDVPPRAP